MQSRLLRDGVYIVEGGVANSGFIIGPDGVIIIDAQRSEADAKTVLSQIGAITNKPVKAIIVTHRDPDHLGGLPAYPYSAEVIAHENTRSTILASAADSANGGPLFGPMYKKLANYLPDRTVADNERVTIAGITVQLLHVGPGHSSGDLIIYLPEQKVVFGGDIVLTNQGRFPMIHKGGSSLGWIRSMTFILALKTNMIVPGHGPIGTRAELQARLADAEKRRAEIKVLAYAGKTLEEVNAALPEKIGNPRFPGFNQTTYEELVKGYPDAVPPWADLVK